MNTLFRAIPSTDICLTALTAHSELAQQPRALLRQAVTSFLDHQRQRVREGAVQDAAQLSLESLLPALQAHARTVTRPRLRRVLNATGVVIHTNMGRSVLAEAAAQAVHQAAANYCNLELDLTTGARGSRYSLVEDVLCTLTGAEAALVVNNNAAAVLLTLDALCRGGEVIVSRGQLVEIGGSFRIPEVMEKSGAVLREVGATNRTHVHDYERAITPNTVALLRVHTSNYRVVGFHKEVKLPELVELGRAHHVPVIEDLGSGSFMDFTAHGLPGEPTVQAIVRGGADVVTFSGDKVLGGPQAGIIVGRRPYIERIRSSPLNRALRCDKFTLAALEATLRLYLDPDSACAHIPTLRMMTADPAELAERAQLLAHRLDETLNRKTSKAHISLHADVSRVGGGSFPECDLPTTLVRVQPTQISATVLKQRLLDTDPPLMGRLEEQCFCLDVRTLRDDEFALVCAALAEALG